MGLRSLGAHDHPIKLPGPHRKDLRHLWRRRHTTVAVPLTAPTHSRLSGHRVLVDSTPEPST
ncbi:MAG: hypothetical protein F4144_15820 [Acidimicrobiaceae bacterium]|nr:hypothetical protein [Acidimicrobiaceae bacterium]